MIWWFSCLKCSVLQNSQQISTVTHFPKVKSFVLLISLEILKFPLRILTSGLMELKISARPDCSDGAFTNEIYFISRNMTNGLTIHQFWPQVAYNSSCMYVQQIVKFFLKFECTSGLPGRNKRFLNMVCHNRTQEETTRI